MASLRSLLSDLAPQPIGNPNTVFYVRNTDTGAGASGCCCLFTVPAGFTSISFEMWGAGGGGAGARCCERAGTMATGGSYALKTISTAAGCQYRICAAGSTGCGGCCGIQPRANPSYVFDITANATIGCAVGGTGGCSQMTRGGFCYGYICCWGLLSGTGLGDIVIDGTGGTSFVTCHCNTDIHMMTAGGFGSESKTAAFCAKDPSGSGPYHKCTVPSWPAGGGSSARSCGGGYCHGQHGSQGLVKVSYQ